MPSDEEMHLLQRFLCFALVAVPALAQTPPRARVVRPLMRADTAESAVKQAADQLGAERKIFERDIEVLAHLRAADAALADTMQPATAVQKAYEAVGKARSLPPEFLVMQGVIRAHQELETARRSPTNTDFGRLRSIIRDLALGPASRVAVRNALRLEDETLAWIKVQQLIADHLKVLTEIASQSLRAAEE
jgi:hypothetical protein